MFQSFSSAGDKFCLNNQVISVQYEKDADTRTSMTCLFLDLSEPSLLSKPDLISSFHAFLGTVPRSEAYTLLLHDPYKIQRETLTELVQESLKMGVKIGMVGFFSDPKSSMEARCVLKSIITDWWAHHTSKANLSYFMKSAWIDPII
mgnify:CR=1 FL=1